MYDVITKQHLLAHLSSAENSQLLVEASAEALRLFRSFETLFLSLLFCPIEVFKISQFFSANLLHSVLHGLPSRLDPTQSDPLYSVLFRHKSCFYETERKKKKKVAAVAGKKNGCWPGTTEERGRRRTEEGIDLI